MDKTKKAKYVYIPLRNLLIVCLCAVCVLFVSERVIENNKKEESTTAAEQKKEDFSVRYMNYVKNPIVKANEKSAGAQFFFKMMDLGELLDIVSDAPYPLAEVCGKKQYPEDTYNIVIVGDSFVWGDGCTNRNELFWRQLELLTEEKGYNCRVYGVGTAGATSYEELSWLTETDMIEDLSPDILIMGFVENDPDMGTTFQGQRSNELKEQLPVLKKLSKVFPGLCDSLSERIRVDTLFTKKYGENLNGKDVYVLTGDVYDYYKENFLQPLNDFASRADFPVVYMTLPLEPYRYYFKKLYRPLHELFGEADNIRFYDCLDAFCEFGGEEHEGNYAMSPVNQHPGTASNYFYANYILSFLENDFALAEKCGRIDEKDDGIYINDAMPGNMNVTELPSGGKETAYRFTYPSEHTAHETRYYSFKDFLYLPIREDYVKLCFSRPTDIASVSFTCENAEEIKLYYTRINKDLGYDDHSVIPVEKDGKVNFVFGSDGLAAVTALCVHAEITNGEAADIVVRINEKGED